MARLLDAIPTMYPNIKKTLRRSVLAFLAKVHRKNSQTPPFAEFPFPNTMTPIPIDAARKIASMYNYAEICLNKTSRVVSFRNMENDIKIKIYYTTGTVGTCLKHPNNGETQLVRRERTPHDLEEIFKNPGCPTGVGYCRRK
jgi:hypothetical protein